MRVLDRALGLELQLVAPSVGRTVVVGDETPRLRARFVGNPEGVGTHVGDQAYWTLGAKLDTFIQLLRQAHRAIGLQAQATGRILLQRAGLVGWRRVSRAVLGLDRQHLVARPIELGHDLLHLAFLGELELLLAALLAVQPRGEDALW